MKRRGVGHDVAGCGTAAGCHQWRRRCGRARVRIGGSHLRFTIFGTHTMCPQTLISDRRIASTATAGLSLPTNRLRTRTGHVWLRTRPGIERQPLRLDVVKVVEAGVRKGGGTDERRCEAAVLLVAQRCRNTAKRGTAGGRGCYNCPSSLETRKCAISNLPRKKTCHACHL